jgi:hypothetical protein
MVNSTEKWIGLKKEADEIMKIKGNVRGVVFQTHAAYIKQREGEKGVAAVEKKMEDLGYPVEFKNIKPFSWYQEALSALVILVAKEIFDWSEADIFDMGSSAPKYSLIVKLLMKYFLSLGQTIGQSPKYWAKHYDFGRLESCQFDSKNKSAIIRIYDYKNHPLVCIFFKGYFSRIVSYATKNRKIDVEETKCPFRGDNYHEYSIKWE